MEPVWLVLVTIALYLSSFQWLAFSGQQQQMNFQQQNQQQTQLLMTMPLLNQMPANRQTQFQEYQLLEKLLDRLDVKSGLESKEEFLYKEEEKEPNIPNPIRGSYSPVRKKFHHPEKYVPTPPFPIQRTPQIKRPVLRDSLENPRHLNWNQRPPQVFNDGEFEVLRGGDELCDHQGIKATFVRPPRHHNLHMVSSNDKDGFPRELLPSSQNLPRSSIKPEKSLGKPLESFKSPLGSGVKPSESSGKPRKSFRKGHYDFSNSPIAPRAELEKSVGGHRGNFTTIPPPLLPFKYPNKPFPYTRDFTPFGLAHLDPSSFAIMSENTETGRRNEPTTISPLELDTFNGSSQLLDPVTDEFNWDDIFMNVREEIAKDALNIIKEFTAKESSKDEEDIGKTPKFVEQTMESARNLTEMPMIKVHKKSIEQQGKINSYIISQIIDNHVKLNQSKNEVLNIPKTANSNIRVVDQKNSHQLPSYKANERSINHFTAFSNYIRPRQSFKNASKVNRFILNALNKNGKLVDGQMGWG